MATKQFTESSSWLPKSTSPSDVQLYIHGLHFTFNKELLAARSAKVAALLKEHPHEDISYLLRDIPADSETFELVVKFCHGHEVNVSTENVIPLSCLAHYLGMSENHSANNLLKKALTHFEQKVLSSWNESVKALRASENVLRQAMRLGLLDACVESIVSRALNNPCLLGEPRRNTTYDDDGGEDEENKNRLNVKRRLFDLNRKSEDMTTLSLQLYEPIICAMIQRGVPPPYVAASLCRYTEKCVFSGESRGDDMSIYRKNSQREAIEAVERLLPGEIGLLPSTLLSKMLESAIALEASSDCRNGFETRIGKQLDQATVKDLLIPSQGYSKEMEYDVDCVRRILKNFYCNYARSDISGLIAVAELLEEFLAEVASDADFKASAFVSLAEMSNSASVGMQRSADGIYRAIDIYLDKHRYLTESEKEDVCQVLDCHKLSPEAREHAAQNERLPMRVGVQVLFAGQLHLRETIAKEVQDYDDRLRKLEIEEEEEAARVSSCEEEVRMEMEKMGNKVMELERECNVMKEEIQSVSCSRGKKERVGVWREMKRKFGCISSNMPDCNCHVKRKKVHPRQVQI